MDFIRKFMFSPKFENYVVSIIILNSIFLGLGTTEYMQRNYGEALDYIDSFFVLLFATELAFKMYFLRLEFFKNGWNVFDFIVVAIPLLSSIKQLSILRSLRILRLMRLLHFIPRFQKVVDSFLISLPGIAGIFSLLMLIFYTFGVMGTSLFGRDHPQFFGSLGASLFTVMQVATIGGWADTARTVMETHPLGWVYFVSILLTTTLTVLNLIVTLLVDSVQELRDLEKAESGKKDIQLEDIYKQIKELKSLLKK